MANATRISPLTRPGKERPVIYRGIKILPMVGKRSKVAEAIRKALLESSRFEGV